MWRGGRCLQGRDWQECIFLRWGAPWQPGSQRWGEVRALAPQCASSSEQGGGPIQHESHRNLQRSSWQTDHGEDPDSEFQRASFDEQEERDGWSEGGQDAISEVGWQQLGLPGRRSPRSTVNSLEEAEEEVNNPAGGARGGWRRCGLRASIFAAR